MSWNSFKSKFNKQLWDDVVAVAKFVFDLAGVAGTTATFLYGMNVIGKETRAKWCRWDWTRPQ